MLLLFFFFNDTATTEIYTYSHTLSLHDALPIFHLHRLQARERGHQFELVERNPRPQVADGIAPAGHPCADALQRLRSRGVAGGIERQEARRPIAVEHPGLRKQHAIPDRESDRTRVVAAGHVNGGAGMRTAEVADRIEGVGP